MAGVSAASGLGMKSDTAKMKDRVLDLFKKLDIGNKASGSENAKLRVFGGDADRKKPTPPPSDESGGMFGFDIFEGKNIKKGAALQKRFIEKENILKRIR